MAAVSGTEGYAEEADKLFELYDSVSLEAVHGPVLHLIPAGCTILDIGAGTGRDAGAFATRGHRVVAVEPVAALRTRAITLHPSPLIEWVDDNLPDLAATRARGELFDVVLLTAVWFHLDEGQRPAAMKRVAPLVRPGGAMILTLRHGPVPPGRRMFAVTAEETVRLAQPEGLRVVMNQAAASVLPRPVPVTWTRLAFVRE